MRTYLLRVLVAVAAISVLLFASVAYAQDDDPVAECEARGGEWFDWGPRAPKGCSLDHPQEYAKVLELRALIAQRDECEAAGGVFSVGRDGFLAPVPHCSLSGEPASGALQAQPEPAPVGQTPTEELPATQPAQAQQGSPQFTG